MNINAIKTITIRAKTEGVGQASSELDKLAGSYDGVAKSAQTTATVTDQTAKRTLSVADAYKRQSSRIDETVRSQERIARETKIADSALREGLVTQAEHADRLSLIQTRYNNVIVATDKFGKSTGFARHELINLSRQAQDVGVSLASGQSPFTVLVQQGSQIADVFASSTATVGSFFSQAGGWAARFVTSAAGIATGLVGIGAGALYAASSWQTGQRDIERALIGIGKQSGATVKDINSIASSSATTFGLSVDQAREAALEFVKTGAIYKDNIKTATDATHNFSIVTGQGAKEAAQELAKALASPLEGADALNIKLGFLDGRTREYIATLVSQNQKQEAQAVLLRNLTPAIQEATNTLGPFEKAWDAVANAAIRAKNAIGQAITPQTDEQRRDALVGIVNRQSAPTLEGTPVDTRGLDKSKIAAARQEIEALNEKLRETARASALAFSGDRKLSLDADNAVRELVPYIDQLKKVEEQLNRIKAAQESPQAQERQGLSGANEEAARAAEVLKMNIQAAREETDRANERAIALAAAYGTSSVEVAKLLSALQSQLGVAQAVTGAAQIEAQYHATINALLNEGKSLTDAIAVATAQRAISIAQVNAEADRMLISLRQEGELIRASSDFERDRIAAAQTYQNLIDKRVDSTKALAIASQQLANADEKRFRAEQEATERALAGIRTREDAWNAYASGVISWTAANDEAARINRMNDELRQTNSIMAVIIARMIEWNRRWELASNTLKHLPAFLIDAMGAVDKLFDSKQGGKTQFNPAGYQIKSLTPTAIIGQQVYGPGGLDDKGLPTAQGMQYYFDKMLEKAGGSFASVATDILSGGLLTQSALGQPAALDTNKVNLLNRAIEVLPSGQQAGLIQQEIGQLQSGPASLETAELIKQLTDKLTQLTQATEDNTSATQSMTDVLSPLYSSDPRRTHLGFRAFAGGGIMTPWGEVPLHKYDGGGIANTPQMAIFGEGSTPEAYVPVPSGRIPVEIKQPANSNKPPTVINVNVSMTSNVSRDEARKTGFQIAQAANRALGR